MLADKVRHECRCLAFGGRLSDIQGKPRTRIFSAINAWRIFWLEGGAFGKFE
jgi:hypothetical protein